jgi:hypothetical protein
MADTGNTGKPAPSTGRKIAGFIGFAAFLVGLLLALIGGATVQIGASGKAEPSGAIVLVLVILGILVGVLNISGKEVIPLLIAAIALIVVGNTTAFQPLDDLGVHAGTRINAFVALLAAFMAPAAVISAFRAILAVARPGD